MISKNQYVIPHEDAESPTQPGTPKKRDGRFREHDKISFIAMVTRRVASFSMLEK